MQEHKYKVGDRFVIEISSLPMSSDGAYYLTSGKTFYPECVLDNLPQFPNDEDENDLYMLTQEEKSVVEDRAYNKGLNDAWKVFTHVQSGELSFEEIRRVWDMDEIAFVNSFTEKYTPQEAIKILREYEEKRIAVGDVILLDGEKFIIIALSSNEVFGYGLDEKYNDFPIQDLTDSMNEVVKTGKHFDIAEIMKQITQ